MKQLDYYLLIHKALSGQISKEEKGALEEWLCLRQENKQLFNEIKLVWENSGSTYFEKEIPYDPEEELSHIKARMKEITRKEKRLYTSASTHKFTILKIAAVVLLLILSNLGTWSLLQINEIGFPEVKIGDNLNELFLADGTKVSLNKNTNFRFEQSKNRRDAYLEGEAYFDVAKDKDRPFFVHIPNATVKVVGTSFNINSKANDDSTVITVSSGTVEVLRNSESVALHSGEMAVFSNSHSSITRKENSDLNFDAWKTGIYKFKNTELRRILALLEDQYDVEFRVKNKSILSCRFTGTFNNDRLEKILQVLAYGLDFEYRFHDDHYLLSGKGCKKSK